MLPRFSTRRLLNAAGGAHGSSGPSAQTLEPWPFTLLTQPLDFGFAGPCSDSLFTAPAQVWICFSGHWVRFQLSFIKFTASAWDFFQNWSVALIDIDWANASSWERDWNTQRITMHAENTQDFEREISEGLAGPLTGLRPVEELWLKSNMSVCHCMPLYAFLLSQIPRLVFLHVESARLVGGHLLGSSRWVQPGNTRYSPLAQGVVMGCGVLGAAVTMFGDASLIWMESHVGFRCEFVSQKEHLQISRSQYQPTWCCVTASDVDWTCPDMLPGSHHVRGPPIEPVCALSA